MSRRANDAFPISHEARVHALDHFQFWSNLLVVTTGVALGWVATKDAELRPWAIVTTTSLLALSAVLGIVTLAIVPHVRQRLDGDGPSICAVTVWPHPVPGWRAVPVRLPYACWLQHVTLIAAFIVFAIGVGDAQL